jgi:MFS family permease
MQVVAPDLLAEACELSAAVSAAGLVLGLLLWLFGWRGHRFWVVLAATLLGGVAGLSASPAYGAQPLVAGLLAAVAAGVLALALVRVVAFAAGGLAACLLVRTFVPALDQPLLAWLVGGLVGVFFFRFWTMALTSLLGTLLIAYSALSLLQRLAKLQAAPWSDRNAQLLNGLCAGGCLLGVLSQLLLERWRARRQRRREEQAKLKKAQEEEKRKKEEEKKKAPPPKRPWWGWPAKKAG